MKPNSILRSWLVAVCFLFIASLSAFAQGTAFTYQGLLTQGGVPANGSNDLTFTLYDADNGGGTVGASNVVNDLAITNGLFTVTLSISARASPARRAGCRSPCAPARAPGLTRTSSRASPSRPRPTPSSPAA